jgi:hypothetical protein
MKKLVAGLHRLLYRIPFRNPGFSHYVDMLEKNRPFSFARYGDGEWNAIFGEPGRNCDGHPYYPELGAALRATLENPGDYIHAIQPRAVKYDSRRIHAYLASLPVPFDWHDADVFHDANKAGDLFPLVRRLREMRVVMVGPEHLRTLGDRLFAYSDFVEVPAQNCYMAKDDLAARILAHNDDPPTVFAVSASMAAKVLIHALHPVMGGRHWLLDFGSLWDIYAGVKSRGVYAKLDWSKIIPANLGTAQ